MHIYHNSHKAEYRSPFGACEAGSEVTLSLDIANCEPERVRLIVKQDDAGTERWGEMFEAETGRYSITLNIPLEGTLLWYCFAVDLRTDSGIRTVYYGNDREGLGGEGAVYLEHPVMYQITVYVRSEVPEWYKNGIVYQIFPGRFARDPEWRERCMASAADVAANRNDTRRIIEDNWYKPAYYVRGQGNKIREWPLYGGSIKGIISRLNYLRTLGVTAIYLNPVFESVSNHHYDTADYLKIDPSLGTEEDFIELAARAKELGIRLILDGVFSHTGDDSVYFDRYGYRSSNGAYHDPDSPYRSWYKFDNSEPCGYKSWWGIEDLPEVIEDDPSFTEMITGTGGVIEKWMKAGASGWRLDVADELPDGFIREIRKRIRETDPEGLIIGEVWEDASNKVSYGERRRYFAGDELDGTMNYPLRSALLDYVNYTISSGKAGRKLMSLRENYPEENFYASLNLIGSHDRQRILTAMAADKDYESAVSKVRLLSVLQFTLPGVPCIYYGDEAGLAGGADPANRSGFPWGREDKGLSFHYRMLGLIYREHPVLAGGKFEMLSGRYGINDDIMAFVRYDENERIVVLTNRSYGGNDVDLRNVPEVCGGYAIDLLTSKEIPMKDGRTANVLHMNSLSSMIICLRDEAPDQYIRERSAGVICHISSLGKPVLGKPAREFVDYLVSAGMKVWQVLPVNPGGLGDSPYSSKTAFAGNPAFINYDELPDDSLYEEFCEQNMYWLTEYAAFCVMKEISGDKDWRDWYPMHRDADPVKLLKKLSTEYSDRIDELVMEQYYFWMQWNDLHEYANARGVRIMGDLPIYMDSDSADVWANRELFRMDENGRLQDHAGVPADGFNADGQDWGNPLYDWEHLREDGYKWWLRRIRQCAERYDILRLDHFRGFSEYYAIIQGGRPAEGLWLQGPGLDFFTSVRRMLDEEGLELEILAEDLGHLDIGVTNLLALTGLSGMDVWQFSADEIRELGPDRAAKRACYTGTHDNNTFAGYISSKYPELDDLNTGIRVLEEIREIYSSPAVLAMIQLQDLFLLGEDARMNVPGIPDGNWKWKIPGDSVKEAFPDAEDRAAWFRELAAKTGRL